MRIINLWVLSVLSVFAFGTSVFAQVPNHFEELGLKGKVENIAETEFQVSERYGRQGESRRYRCSFDTAGHKTEERFSEASGMLLLRVDYDYDNAGRLTQECSYNSSNTLVNRRTFTYEAGKVSVREQGVLTKVCQYNNNKLVQEDMIEDNRVAQQRTCKYNELGQLTEEQQRKPQGTILQTSRFTYNGRGLLIKKQEFGEKGLLDYECSLTYDDKGHMTSETSGYTNDSERTVVQYKYVYDEQDNWTEMTESMNGKTYAVTVRRVSYY